MNTDQPNTPKPSFLFSEAAAAASSQPVQRPRWVTRLITAAKYLGGGLIVWTIIFNPLTLGLWRLVTAGLGYTGRRQFAAWLVFAAVGLAVTWALRRLGPALVAELGAISAQRDPKVGRALVAPPDEPDAIGFSARAGRAFREFWRMTSLATGIPAYFAPTDAAEFEATRKTPVARRALFDSFLRYDGRYVAITAIAIHSLIVLQAAMRITSGPRLGSLWIVLALLAATGFGAWRARVLLPSLREELREVAWVALVLRVPLAWFRFWVVGLGATTSTIVVVLGVLSYALVRGTHRKLEGGA